MRLAHLNTVLADLVRFPSVTPKDEGCQDYMIRFLKNIGFECQRFDSPPVSNFFARYGKADPLFIFAGHTDVVSPGTLEQWHSDPFELTEQEGRVYGRGVADMKGSLAAMMVMAKAWVEDPSALKGSLGFLITSGEEGDDFQHGTPYVMAKLQEQGIHPTYCLVGEPSSSKKIADVIKIGRRGSLTGKLILEGKQGHVAYPHLADNPIHRIQKTLLTLTQRVWDQGNAYFPPTSFQITQIQAGVGANNVIPGELTMSFNLRYSTEQTAERLKEQVVACFAEEGLNPSIEWQLNGTPFLTKEGRLLEASIHAIEAVLGYSPELSTTGGTSDGRFIAPYGVEVIELGPINATIHQANECVDLNDLNLLATIYQKITERLFL